jgi:hypothetical protein
MSIPPGISVSELDTIQAFHQHVSMSNRMQDNPYYSIPASTYSQSSQSVTPVIKELGVRSNSAYNNTSVNAIPVKGLNSAASSFYGLSACASSSGSNATTPQSVSSVITSPSIGNSTLSNVPSSFGFQSLSQGQGNPGQMMFNSSFSTNPQNQVLNTTENLGAARQTQQHLLQYLQAYSAHPSYGADMINQFPPQPFAHGTLPNQANLIFTQQSQNSQSSAPFSAGNLSNAEANTGYKSSLEVIPPLSIPTGVNNANNQSSQFQFGRYIQ